MNKMNKRKMTLGFITLVIALLVVGLGQGWSTTYNINNFKFDDPSIVLSEGASVRSVPGWTIENGIAAGTFNPSAASYSPTSSDYPNGNVAWVGGLAGAGAIFQTLINPDTLLPYTLLAGHQYTLDVDVGYRLQANCLPCTYPTDPGYLIELYAGGSAIASVSSPVPTVGGWTTAELIYTAASDGGPLGIRLSSGLQTNFDNVRLSNHTPVPEPATLLLLGSGLLGAWFGKKKFKA